LDWRVTARRWGLGLAAASLALIVITGVAWAHPSLVRSEPPANSTLDTSPGQVAVWLDEAIEPDYAHLSVYDNRGQRVDLLDAQYMPAFTGDAVAAIVVSLPPLPQGSYVVVWRVISVGDGHPVGGAFAFGVGVPPDTGAAASAAAEANIEPDLSTHLIRFVGLLAQLVLLGWITFRALVWVPSMRAVALDGLALDEAALTNEARRYLTVAADILVGALVIGSLGALYVQARATGVVFWELFGTRWGAIWIVRAVVALTVAVLLEGILEGKRPLWFGGGLALTLVVTTTLTSHSAAQPGWLGLAADLAHQAGAAVWLGGLLLLVIGLLSARRAVPQPARDRLRAEWVARFTGLAAASVGVLLASGLALAGQQVGDWPSLLLTRYGQAVLIKAVIVAGALAFAAYNSLRAARSARWVAVEAAVVLGALLLAARLTDLPPGVSTTTADEATAPETLSYAAQAGSLSLEGQLTPARTGTNVFALRVLGPDGLAVEGADVRLSFLAVGSALATDAQAAETGVGVYMVSSPALVRQGDWQMLVSVARPGAPVPDYGAVDLKVGLDGVVRLAADPLPWPVRAAPWLVRFGRLALAGLALAVAVGWSWFAGRAVPRRLRLGGWVAGLLVAAIVVTLVLINT
jgi:copper transport protein